MQSISPWGAFFLGMAAAFAVMLCWKLLHRSSASRQDEMAAPAVQKAAPITAPTELPIVDRAQFVAAVSAAIATAMGTDPQGLRIRSIRRVGSPQPADRGQFVAAVSAAIATAMGTEPQGLRIRSIRRIGGGQPNDRAQFVAAVAAALATAMGTEPQGLRIHSVKAV